MRNSECGIEGWMSIPHSTFRIGGEQMQEHHIGVTRSARYFTLGDSSRGVGEVWFVCHGYGQLAARFLEKLRVLDDGRRYLVAPEGLSRFYLTESPTERRGRGAWVAPGDPPPESEGSAGERAAPGRHRFLGLPGARAVG